MRSAARSSMRQAELAPDVGPACPGNCGFIRRRAVRGCRAANEALSVFCCRSSYADARRYRTRFENAHRIACREVLYRLHPWFGREVFVHAAIDKADGGVFQCSVDGSDVERWLEIPAWMFDHGACAGDVRFSTAPFVCLEALSGLSTLLDQVLKTTAR